MCRLFSFAYIEVLLAVAIVPKSLIIVSKYAYNRLQRVRIIVYGVCVYCLQRMRIIVVASTYNRLQRMRIIVAASAYNRRSVYI